jgi:glycosyltransferase involved in cell wall biosynthesis
MRIGIDITSLAGERGPARYTTEIINALSIVCNQDDIFYLFSPFKKNIDGLPANFVFKMLPLQKIRPWLNWTLPVAVRREKIDVMFFPANDFWLWRAAPTVVTLFDIALATELFQYLSSWRDRLQNRLQMKALGKVAYKVITISQFSAKSIVSFVPGVSKKVEVVYCGISGLFQGGKAKNTASPGYILFVGGFDRRKNLERLLKAYKLLLVRGRTDKLLLVGSAGQNKKLYYDMPEMIAVNDLQKNVEIKSVVDDNQLVQLYGNARLLVLPSLIEGFGLPVLEAMACGCPVALSNAASLPEVGGDAAIYFDPYDVQGMADCIERILTDDSLRQEMISKGLEQVKKFSWQKAGEQVYGILQKVETGEI